MNFFGHALTAAWADPDPRFALGAMLPDFATMAGVRQPDPDDPAIGAGVAWHHRTDAAFHECADFSALIDRGRAALLASAVGRGPALAASHVGIELLLDGELCADARVVDHYRAALACRAALVPAIRAVVDRLAAAGAPHWYRDPDEVTRALLRILGRRPRLALAPADLGAVRRWLGEVQPQVRDAVPSLLAELSGRLR